MSTGKTNICAIVINYKNALITRNCLLSLSKQNLSSILVIDNSEDEHSQNDLKRTISEIESMVEYSVLLMCNKKNYGFGKAINLALEWLETNNPHSYYLLVNNDAQAEPGMLNKMYDVLRYGEIAMVSPQIVVNKIKGRKHYYNPATGLITTKPLIGSFEYLAGCCLLINKKMFNLPTLFDEDFFMYGEDIELTWRIKSNNMKYATVEGAYIYHEGTGSSSRCSFFYNYHITLGHKLLANKLTAIKHKKIIYSINRLIIMFSRSIIRSLKCKSLDPIKAYFSVYGYSKSDLL